MFKKVRVPYIVYLVVLVLMLFSPLIGLEKILSSAII